MFEFDPINHIYRFNGSPVMSVTQILRTAGLIEFSEQITPEVLENARKRGTDVHAACAFRTSPEFDWGGVGPGVKGYVEAFDKFLTATGILVEAVEEANYHPAYLYAGTLDLRGVLPSGQRILIDLKTYEAAPWTGLQLAGYAGFLKEKHERWGVWLKPEGEYRIKKFNDLTDWDVFLACLSVANWKKNKGVKR